MPFYPTSLPKVRPIPRPRKRWDTPKPANDNWRGPGRPPKDTAPANNDNQLPDGAGSIPRPTPRQIFDVARRLAGLTPYGRALRYADDIGSAADAALRFIEMQQLPYAQPAPGSGYILHKTCASAGPPSRWLSGNPSQSTTSGGSFCLSGQYVTSTRTLAEYMAQGQAYVSGWEEYRTQAPSFRHSVTYKRIGPRQAGSPWTVTEQAVEVTRPIQMPALDPFATPGNDALSLYAPHMRPPGLPAPHAPLVPAPGTLEAFTPLVPAPIRAVVVEPSWNPSRNPAQDPSKQPGQNPVAPTAPRPAPSLWPSSPPAPDPWTNIGVTPQPLLPSVNPTVEITPGGNTSTRPGQQHNQKPPGPGVRETKGIAERALNKLGNAFGSLTEWNDAVSAAHAALPKDKQAVSYWKGKRITPSWKKQWNAVWKHWREMDLETFTKEYAKAQATDQVIGRLAKGARLPGQMKYLNRFSGISG